MRFRRRRRRFGRWALLVGIGLLLIQRRLRGGRSAGWVPPREEWPDLARDAAFWSFPFFTPVGMALRLGERLVRQFFG
jgi:hypothetical protein